MSKHCILTPFKNLDGDELGIHIGGVKCPVCCNATILRPPNLFSNVDFWECSSCGKSITNESVNGLVGTLQQILFGGKNAVKTFICFSCNQHLSQITMLHF